AARPRTAAGTQGQIPGQKPVKRRVAQKKAGQAAQVKKLKKTKSQGIIIDDSELGEIGLDGKVVNPWEATSSGKDKTEEQKREEERIKLRAEIKDSTFLKSNKSYRDDDEPIVYERLVDPKKKTLVTALLIITLPISIILAVLAILLMVGTVACVLLFAGVIVLAVVGIVVSVFSTYIAITGAQMGSILFFAGIALICIPLILLMIYLIGTFITDAIPGMFRFLRDKYESIKDRIHEATLEPERKPVNTEDINPEDILK
ncbi:MAG: hypothetical protein K6D02_08390, partial [Lachnospiraceae bacterium]|nr:hypothetical protein [Lachnospiraceae bacterium]